MAVALQLHYSCITVVLQLYSSCITVVLQLYYSCITGVLHQWSAIIPVKKIMITKDIILMLTQVANI